jgi:endonuclease/exonuclease/phosphatase (EEP) superfamily protein YafD
VIDIDLLSSTCWRDHFEDRVQRRKSIQSLRDQLEDVPAAEPLIVGGDFNVPAFDGCLSPLRNRLIDTFAVAGRGWGHTVLNDLPLFRIDQVWISVGLQCDSVRAFQSENSDHRLVVCKLRY